MDVLSRGKESVSAIGGGLSFEKDKNRIIGRDEDGVPSLVISSEPSEKSIVKVARQGANVLTAEPDDLVMSSDFNMYKIISTGSAEILPRDANLTLSGNNIAYMFIVLLETNIPEAKALDGDLRIKVVDAIFSDIQRSGVFYDDGTNKAVFADNYQMIGDGRYVCLTFAVRLIAGSVTFNPKTYYNKQIHWDVLNHTNKDVGGFGSIGTPSGKYCYVDQRIYGTDGSQGALVSNTQEFIDGEWQYFPNYNRKSLPFSWFTI